MFEVLKYGRGIYTSCLGQASIKLGSPRLNLPYSILQGNVGICHT